MNGPSHAPAPSPRSSDLAGSLPRAVVFDCDGTIADTETLANRAWAEELLTFGYELTSDDVTATMGRPFPQNWDHFSGRVDLGDLTGFRERIGARFQQLLDHELVIYPDAVATMTGLAAAGVAIGMASSSHHAHVEHILERARLSSFVSAIIGADDVAEHKPLPGPYLAAAAALGVDAVDCAAIEDTPVGLASALAAGMFTVAVVRAHGSRQQLAGAHVVVDELSVDALVAEPREVEPLGIEAPGSGDAASWN